MEGISTQIEKKIKIVSLYEKYMFVMGIVGQFMFYFQAGEIFVRKSAQGVSFFGFLIGLLCVSSWLIYGILIKNKVLIWSNAIATLGAFLVVIGTLIY